MHTIFLSLKRKCFLALWSVAVVTAAAAAPAGKIVYMSQVFDSSSGTNNQQIFIINPDGTGKQQLTNGSNNASFPALSPDGTQIAFFAGIGSQNGIFLMNADGTGITFIPGTDYYCNPVWSFDGTMLAARNTASSGEVAVFAPDGSGFHTITHTENDGPRAIFSLSWSPDGTKIAFTGDTYALRLDQIYIANADGSGSARRLSMDDNTSYQYPAWSPDGTKIACAHYPGIITLDPSTGAETPVTPPPADPNEGYSSPTWSPDGTKLAFTTIVDNQVAIANSDGSNLHELATGRAFYPNWSPATPIPLPPITSFSATGPSQPFGSIHFAATTGGGLKVRVQANTGPNLGFESSWVTLADGGAMTEQPAGSGNYTLDTTAYPAGSDIYFRAIASKRPVLDSVSPKPYAGPFTLHPPTGPQPMRFTVNGRSVGGDNLADAVVYFAADQSATAAGLSVRVQYSTPSTDWTNLPNDNHGVMIIDKSVEQRHYVLNTLNYPLQDNVTFRAIATADGYPPAISNQVGPFNLTSSTPHLGPTYIYLRGNGPVANLRFGVTEPTLPSGLSVYLQSTKTPGAELSWATVSGGTLSPDPSAPNEFYLGLDDYPVSENIYFRAVATASGNVASVSHPVGPVTVVYDPAATVDLTVGNASAHSGEEFDFPVQLPSGSFNVTANVSSTHTIAHLALKLDGDTLNSLGTGSTHGSQTYTTNVAGDHLVEAVATDDIGVVGDAPPVHVRVAPNAPGRLLFIVQSGDWSDPSIWIKADGSPAGSSPGPGDFAVLSDVSVTISSAITVEAVSLNGGTISGSGKLTVTGLCTIGSGRITSDMEIADGGTCLLINDSDIALAGTLTNKGRLKLHGLGGITGVPNQHKASSIQPNSIFDGLIALVKNIGQMIFHRPAGGRIGSGAPKSSVTPALRPETRVVAAQVSNQGQVKVADDSLLAKPIIPVISRDSAGLIGQDGNGIVAQGGGNIVGQGGGNLIGQDGNGLIGQDGNGLIGQDGNNLIGQDGNGIVAQGGGNFVGHNGAAVSVRSSSAAARSFSAATASSGYSQSSGTTDLTGITIDGSVTLDGGILAGTGLILGDLTNNAGYLTPGNSAGMIAVAGNFAQGASGTLVLESGGPRPNQFDHLDVGGSAQLGGKLDVKAINGYQPDASDTFTPLVAGSITGSFANVSSNAALTQSSTGVTTSVDTTKPAPGTGQPLNISTRMEVLKGDNILIGGFIVYDPTGANASKKVLIRALGPSLPVSNTLADPLLELHKPDGSVVSNDNWQSGDTSQIPNGFAPSNPKESLIVATLPPGAYTAQVKGADGGTGIGLVEVYDLSSSWTSKLANISTRGFVDTGDNVMIGGFIVGGQDPNNPLSGEPGKVLVRGIGPSLGVPGSLQATTLELHDANGAVISNEGWRAMQESDIVATTIPPSNDKDSAILATLVPGAYTAVLRGSNNTTGVGLIEAYNLQ